MKMRSISAWFDIWGSMQGNTNEAMATGLIRQFSILIIYIRLFLGVECAKVLLVFLSKAYLESINCLLEFRYAVKRGKAFVVIRTEPNIQLDQWMIKALEGFPQYDVFSYEDMGKTINGVPKVSSIQQTSEFVTRYSMCVLDRCYSSSCSKIS